MLSKSAQNTMRIPQHKCNLSKVPLVGLHVQTGLSPDVDAITDIAQIPRPMDASDDGAAAGAIDILCVFMCKHHTEESGVVLRQTEWNTLREIVVRH